jgi:hypothetical protein
MISFLASPKPFTGIAREHQYRAIRSWLSSVKDVEVILYGDSDGIVEAGIELGVQVVRQIDSAPSGIPYFSSIVEHASEHGKYDLQLYLNCDILLSGIVQALMQIKFPQFLLIGQRIDLGDSLFIDVCLPDWQSALQKIAADGNATLYQPCGIDYFGFRRGLWKELPPVVIGRAGYDNALLAYCFRNRVPIVDATFSVVALHQYHGYGHVSGGQKAVWEGVDARNNIHYAGGRRILPMISDADYILQKSKVTHCPCRGNWLRQQQLKLHYQAGMPNVALVPRLILKGLHNVGVNCERQLTLEEVLANLYGVTN